MRSSSHCDAEGPAPHAPPEAPPGATLRRAEIWALGCGLAFAVLSLGGALIGGGRDVLDRVATVGPALAAALLALSLLNYGIRALRWHLFSVQLRLDVGFGRSLVYFVSGFAMTMTPGKLGELVRLWYLRRWHGVAYRRGMGLAIADRLTDTAAIVLLAGCGAVAFTAHAGAVVGLGALVVAAAAFLMVPDLHKPALDAAYRLTGRGARPLGRVRRSLGSVAALAGWRLLGAALLLGLLGWLAEIVAFHLLLVHLGAEIGFLRALFIFAFAMIVGALAMLPGGLGGTELSMTGLLVASGVDFGTAVAATVVIRATTLWFAVLLGFLTMPLAMRPPAPAGGTLQSAVE